MRRPAGAADGREASGAAGEFEAEALAYLDHLYAAARRLTRDPVMAEDLVQETYLRALRFSHRFTRGTNLRAWLFTILHNSFRNVVRGAGRSRVDVDSEAVEQAAAPSSTHAAPDAALLRATLDADLKAALDALPGPFRQAVWLRDVEEFTYAEIAEMVGVPIGTVMSRISRGRKLLYQRLTERDRPETDATGGGRRGD